MQEILKSSENVLLGVVNYIYLQFIIPNPTLRYIRITVYFDISPYHLLLA